MCWRAKRCSSMRTLWMRRLTITCTSARRHRRAGGHLRAEDADATEAEGAATKCYECAKTPNRRVTRSGHHGENACPGRLELFDAGVVRLRVGGPATCAFRRC